MIILIALLIVVGLIAILPIPWLNKKVYILNQKSIDEYRETCHLWEEMYVALEKDRDNSWSEHQRLTLNNLKGDIEYRDKEIELLRKWIRDNSQCKTCGGNQFITLGMIGCKECGLHGQAPWGG